MRAALRTIVYLVFCTMAGCSCHRTHLEDLQSRDESIPVFDATPACVPCSQTETTAECTPSRCGTRSDGKLCCNIWP